MDAIGAQMGLPSRQARTMTASQLADRLAKPQGEELLAVVGRLRETMAQVARVNRVAGAVSCGILGHLKAIFDSVTALAGKPQGYSGTGRAIGVCGARLIETVG
jgi:hypothetical protein